MKLKIIITALVLSLALPVAAEFRTIQAAYEIALDHVRLPRLESGTIAYKKCAECPFLEEREIYGLVCGKDPEVWGDAGRGLDY